MNKRMNGGARPFFKANLLRISIVIALGALIILPLFAVSSASVFHGLVVPDSNAALSAPTKAEAPEKAGRIQLGLPSVTATWEAAAPFAFMPQAQAPETVAVYQSDCSTPATGLTLGQTVCAKLTGAPIGTRATQVLRRLSIVGPGGYIRKDLDVSGSTSTASVTFTIPSTATSLVGGDTIDNRGSWQAISVSARDGSAKAKAAFTVTDSDPNIKVADLALLSSVSGGDDLGAGGTVTFALYLVNYGPNPAEDVVVTSQVFGDATFVSVDQPQGQAYACENSGDTTTCTIGTLAKGAKAVFTVSYSVNAGTPVGSAIINLATVSTTTAQRSTRDNVTKAAAVTTETTGSASCTLTCPANVVVTANATQNSQFGALVTYSGASVSGDCGAVSNNPASGSFFPVGTHTVTATSETGGGSCTFTVKVLGTPAPTITCPADKNVTAADDADEANVVVGTPTFNASGGGTVVGTRSDSTPAVLDSEGNIITPAVPKPLTDPYPVGITGIVWTVTDADGRTASCTQRIVVSVPCATDTQTPTIIAPDDVTVSTGGDGTGCTVSLDDELGQATATDDCSVTVTISGIPAGNNFPIGTTTLTYTATDPAGHTATDTQTVVVVDNTPPHIAAPANASYTCPSEVPAANPNQATGGDVFDDQGNLLPPGPPFDNCGTPTVTVSETRAGAGSGSDPLIITRTFTATDGAGNSSNAVQTITVTDSTAPTITAPGDVSAVTGPGATSCDTSVSLGTASASDNCAGVTVTRSPAGDTFPVGTTDVIWTATDAAGNQATATQHVTVTDNTAPVVTPPAAVTLYTGAGATSCGVTVSNLDGSLGTGSATDNCPGVGAVTRSGVPSGNVFPVGNTTVTYSATDAHGNSSSATQVVTVVDNTPPTISCPANITVYLPLNSTATSMVVNYTAPTGTDNCAGATTTQTGGLASGATFPVGSTTNTFRTTDAAGNQTECSFTVTVLYDFTGFFSPVGNLPTLNNVNAGRAIPVKFSLSGNKGLAIFAAGYPASQQITCDSSAPIADLEGTVSSGGSTLNYSPDQYNYNWKTESSWAGTCRQLAVKLNDGSVHTANFKFK